MQTPHLPKRFDEGSVVVVEQFRSYQRFLEDESIALQDFVDDYDPECDFEDLREGLCLVALDEEIEFKTRPDPRLFRDSVPSDDPREYVLKLADSFWLAEYRDGTITRRADHPLKDLLEARHTAARESAAVVPMKNLEQFTCYDDDSTPLSARQLDQITAYPHQLMIQFPGAYKELHETGRLAGIMNRSWCHLDCGVDFVWIEEELCLLWIRSDSVPNVEWIRLFPFRVDVSGPPGRLLKGLRDRPVWRRFFGIPFSRGLGNTWYDV